MQLRCSKSSYKIVLNASSDTIACFIDYEKSSDRVKHKQFNINILKKYNTDDQDLQLIKNLHWKQSANVKLGAEYSKKNDVIK